MINFIHFSSLLWRHYSGNMKNMCICQSFSFIRKAEYDLLQQEICEVETH